jgi:hypothetical protein
MRSATGDIVQPVTSEGVVVLLTNKEEGPVVLAVAAGGPLSAAVEFVVGDGDVSGGLPAADDVLTADERELPWSASPIYNVKRSFAHLVVVNPNVVGVGQGDSITTPDVLGVQCLMGLVSALSNGQLNWNLR